MRQDLFAPAFSVSARTISIDSTTTAIPTVFDCDAPSPSSVCSVLSCLAPGLYALVVAACARLPAASGSPSALAKVARFSHSAKAWRDITRFKIELFDSALLGASQILPVATC